MFSVKELVDSGCLKTVPLKYSYPRNPDDDHISFDQETIPTIDFSLLTSGSSEERSKVVEDLGRACQDWGFFMVINHGITKKVREEMMRSTESFFNQKEKEKQEYAGKKVFDPIRYATSFNVTVDRALLWRDCLKILVHPHFVSPRKPHGFSEVLDEYCKRTREVAQELLKGISKSLGLEENYINQTMNVEKGSQMFVANFYPACPEPEIAMGLPPHSDYGLLTILLQNNVEGLQVMHNGEWVTVNPSPDSLLINTGDHMEILTNGKYRSVVHRAVVNNKATRISIGTAHAPPLENVVSPALELTQIHAPAYRGIKFREYVELQQTAQLDGKTCLDRVRI